MSNRVKERVARHRLDNGQLGFKSRKSAERDVLRGIAKWDGTNWSLIVPASSPPVRTNSAMAFDAARGRVMLFGGQIASGTLNDTWEWDGTAWTQRAVASSPES